MPELRKDPIIDRWVIIATERAKRPSDLIVEKTSTRGGFCPLCPGNEDKTPNEIFAIREGNTPPDTAGWRLRVVPNKFPAPRISRSRIAILNPDPSAVYCLMAWMRLRASPTVIMSRGNNKMA